MCKLTVVALETNLPTSTTARQEQLVSQGDNETALNVCIFICILICSIGTCANSQWLHLKPTCPQVQQHARNNWSVRGIMRLHSMYVSSCASSVDPHSHVRTHSGCTWKQLAHKYNSTPGTIGHWGGYLALHLMFIFLHVFHLHVQCILSCSICRRANLHWLHLPTSTMARQDQLVSQGDN